MLPNVTSASKYSNKNYCGGVSLKRLILFLKNKQTCQKKRVLQFMNLENNWEADYDLLIYHGFKSNPTIWVLSFKMCYFFK